MSNEKGVTLVELLVVILIMTFVLWVPISLFNLSIKTESDVRINNWLQREARFITEYITRHFRDGAYFEKVSSDYYLIVNNNNNDSNVEIKKLLHYDHSDKKVYLDPDNTKQLVSQHIVEFTWDESSNLLYMQFNLDGIEYEISTEITHTRIRRS